MHRIDGTLGSECFGIHGAAVGILVAVLGQLLTRSGREEQALMTTLAGLIVVLMLIVQEISQLFSMMKSVFGF